MKIKEDLNTVALGTSKINYLDRRISVASCKRHEVPIEKVAINFSKLCLVDGEFFLFISLFLLDALFSYEQKKSLFGMEFSNKLGNFRSSHAL